MSDSPPPPSDPSSPAPSAPETPAPQAAPAAPPIPPKPRKRRQHTLRHRLWIFTLFLLLAASVFRLSLELLLPIVAGRVARAYGMSCQYDRMSLSLLGGTANVWNLQLRPLSAHGAGDPMIRADYLQGFISPLNLLRGRLVVWRAEADGVDVVAERNADGSMPMLQRFLIGTQSAPISTPAGAAGSGPPPRPIDLRPPLRIDAIRLTHVNVHFRDLSVSPAFDTQVQATVRLSDIGNLQEPARLEVELSADPVLDTLQLRGEIHNTATNIDADLHLLIRGLHPKPAAAYLLPIGVRPIADQLTIRADVKLSIQSNPSSPDVSAKLALSDISAAADDRTCVSLASLSLDASALNASSLKLGQLLIAHGRVSVERSEEGRLQFAGFEVVPAAPAAGAGAAGVQKGGSAKGKPPAASSANGSPFAFMNLPALNAELGEIQLTDMQLSLTDHSFVPAIESTARLDSLTVKNIDLDPARAKSPVTIAGTMSVPGIVGAITVDGHATVVGATKKLSIALRAGHIRPDAARPYLDRLGIDSQFVDGSATGQLDTRASVGADGALSADAALHDITLTDQGRPLATMDRLAIVGQVRQSANGPAVMIHSAEAQGPELTVRRDADGGISALGLRLRPSAPVAAVAPAKKSSEGGSPLAQLPGMLASLNAISLPHISIDQATWNAHVRFEDGMGMLDHPVACTFSGRIHDVNYDPHVPAKPGSGAVSEATGQFDAEAKVPGLADDFSIGASLHQTNGINVVDGSITARGITGRAVAPYLKRLGILPALKDGQFDSQFQIYCLARNDSIEVGGGLVKPAVLREADGTVLASVNKADISKATITAGGISVDRVQIDQPKLAVQRNSDGSFTTFGMRGQLPGGAPAAGRGGGGGAIGPPAALHLPELAIPLKVGSFDMKDGEIDWTDDAMPMLVKTSAVASVSLAGIDFAAGAAPAHLHASASIAGAIDHATADGTLGLAPDAPAADLTVEAAGIRAGPLAAYLPASVSSTFRNGHFSAAIDLAAKNQPAGGIAARVSVDDLNLSDDTSKMQWAHVGRFTIDATRFDPANGVIAIAEVSSSGVSAVVRRLPDGGMEAGGLRMEASPPAAAPPRANSSVAFVPAAQPTAGGPSVAALVAAARRPLPRVTIDRLDLRADRLTVEGALDPNGAPLALANVRLHAPGPLVLAGPNSTSAKPVQLLVEGGLDPVLKQFSVNLSATPFAAEPVVKMDLSAQGISGQGIIDVMPQLGALVQGKQLTDGTLTAHGVATVNYGRRGPRDFDLSRGFTANFLVGPLQYRDASDGPVVAGFATLHGDGITVKPVTGDVRIKLIEMSTPIGKFYRDAAGVHALGMVIPLSSEKSAASAPAKNVSVAGSPAQPKPQARQEPSHSPIRPSAQIRLDRFTISGIDVNYEDRTTSPPTEIPLKTLDVEVDDVSNQMPWTGEQARFNVLCTSDKVWLPARQGEIGTATTRTASGQYLEQRDLFSEITATGKVGIRYRPDGTPALDGWAKTAVDGFELLGIRGLAEQHKVQIGGGVFDDTNDIRFEPNGIQTQNQVVFTNLSLSEPANGPLQGAFKLPVPIDAAIGAVTDADGSITLNVPVPIRNGEISWDDVYLPAVGAVGGVVATAIASAPVKAASDVLNLFGVGGKAGTNAPQIINIPFTAGYADLLDPNERLIVAQVAKQMKDDPDLQVQVSHDLSNADVSRMAVRANPTPHECLVLADRLRRQKAQLLSRRAELAAMARGQIPSQSPSADATLDELRQVDRSLAGIESSLDQLYDMLRPGAELQASRRTRAASLDLARARMEAIRTAIAGGDHGLLDRIHMTVAQSTVAAGAAADSPSGGEVVLTLVFKRH